MNIPQIRLESRFAKIGLQTNQAELQIEQPKADLSIQQPKAELDIERTPSKLSIDQTQAWDDMDLKHISRRNEEAADQGIQDALEGTARRSQQGDELMRIENGGNPIASQAEVNSQSQQFEFNIGYVPSPFSVKIDFQPSTVKINVKRNDPIIESKINKPVYDYKPGNVDVTLVERNSLKIDFVNTKA